MHNHVEYAYSNVDFTTVSSCLGVWDKVTETHQQVECCQADQFVESLDICCKFRLERSMPLQKDDHED